MHENESNFIRNGNGFVDLTRLSLSTFRFFKCRHSRDSVAFFIILPVAPFLWPQKQCRKKQVKHLKPVDDLFLLFDDFRVLFQFFCVWWLAAFFTHSSSFQRLPRCDPFRHQNERSLFKLWTFIGASTTLLVLLFFDIFFLFFVVEFLRTF